MRIIAVLVFFSAISFLIFSFSPSNNRFDLSDRSTAGISKRISLKNGTPNSGISRILEHPEFKKTALPEIQQQLTKMNDGGLLPNGLANIVQLDWETNLNDSLNLKIQNTLRLLANLREQATTAPPSKLFCSIVHDKQQVMILLSVEDLKSKNRIWELGISIKKNPTKSL